MTRSIKVKIVGYEVVKPDAPTGSSSVIQPQDLDQGDSNRRIRIANVPSVVMDSMRSPGRPETPDGADGRIYYVKTDQHRFAIFISQLDEDPEQGPYAFECWVNGADQPRGLGAIAKVLSADMRQMDNEWLFHKLDLLSKVNGEPCEIQFPGKGKTLFASPVAAVAALIRHRLEELGYERTTGDNPVMDALFFRKEPKTGPDGTMSWTCDVHNPRTGDDFVMGVKEMDLPNEAQLPYRRIPYSLWLSNKYPRILDGLCKILSKDMHVCDMGWIALKLEALRDYKEPNAEFLARVPGENRQKLYPSTEAYIATLLTHRYQMLGILDGDGKPVHQLGLLPIPANVVEFRPPIDSVDGRKPGRECEKCHMPAVIKRDGCDFCTACGELGSCG